MTSDIRAGVDLDFQYGAEATPGAGGAANRKFAELVCLPDYTGEMHEHRGQALKGLSSTTLGNMGVTIPFSGPWNFNDLAVLHAVHGNYAAPVAGGDGTYLWTSEPSMIARNSPKTLCGEWGEATKVQLTGGIVIPDLKLVAARGGLEVSGTMIGMAPDMGDTVFTATPTQPPAVPADEIAVGVWLTDLLADLGDSGQRWNDAYKVEVAMNGFRVPDYPINVDNAGYDGTVEAVPDFVVTFTTRYNAAGLALYANMQAGDRKYMRLWALGPVFGTGSAQYEYTLDIPLVITKVPKAEDVDAVRGLTYELKPVKDSGFSYKLYKAVTRCAVANLT